MVFKVRGVFNLRGRKFRLSFRNLRERARKGAYLRYYMRQPGEDARSVWGKRLDITLGLLLVWFFGFVLLMTLTGSPGTALVLSLPLPAAGVLLVKKFLPVREQKNRFRRRLWLAGQKFMEDVVKMKAQEEFIPLVRDILVALPGFEQVRVNKSKNEAGEGTEPGVNLEGRYKGTLVAVCCQHREEKQKIGPDEVRALAGTLRRLGYKNGLLVTSGDFGTGVLAVVNRIRRQGINIKLVNRYGLMELARQAGVGAFELDGAFSGSDFKAGNIQHARNMATGFRDAAFASRKKAKSYFFYGLLLYGGYILLKGHMLSYFYLFFAVFNFFMGAGCFLFGSSLEETDPLEGLAD